MKRLLLACVLGSMAWGVQAQPALSCDEVNEVGAALDELGAALEAGGEVGDSEDLQLGDITVGLADIAEAENDEDLANASLGMAEAWAANDRDAFLEALAHAVNKLAEISSADCE